LIANINNIEKKSNNVVFVLTKIGEAAREVWVLGNSGARVRQKEALHLLETAVDVLPDLTTVRDQCGRPPQQFWTTIKDY
jgi:hypothetical protein